MKSPDVHIIHDHASDERNKFMTKTIREQHIRPVLWPAVYGSIAEAHKQVVRYAMEKDLDEVIIAEDDLFFYAPDGFKYFLDNKPPSFDIYLSGVYYSTPELPNKGNIVQRFAGMHLYIIAKKFYRQFICAPTDLINSIDNALSLLACMGFGDYKCCYPYAAVQREELPSTNPLLYGNIYKHKYFFNSKNLYGYKEIEASG